MEDQTPRNPAAAPSGAGVPATSAARDANGFDPAEFHWKPVPRRPRPDGWSVDMQQQFIGALARLGVVEHACRDVGMSVSSAYALRNAPGGEGFARAWANALTRAADRVLDIAFEQAIVGEEIPIYDRDGLRVGSKWKYNTRMAMNLLRAYHPDRFRYAHREMRGADEPPPPPAVPIQEAIASLAPETPAEPHRLVSPHTLAADVEAAREEAARIDADPAADREPWRAPRVPDPHPVVAERAARARARRERREEAAQHADRLAGDVSYDDQPPPVKEPVTEAQAHADYSYWVRYQEQQEASTSPPLLRRTRKPAAARKAAALASSALATSPTPSAKGEVTPPRKRAQASTFPPLPQGGCRTAGEPS